MIGTIVFLVGLALQALICWFQANFLSALPAQHRKQEPALVWLLMIPLVNLVLNFFLFPGLSGSYRSYFDEHPELEEHGDCGRGLGIAYSCCVACSLIPCIGFVFGLAALCLVVLFLLKAQELGQRIVRESI